MMLAVLDPRIFEEGHHLQGVLRQTAQLLIGTGANVPEVYPYWIKLEESFSKLRKYNPDLDRIRERRRRLHLPQTLDSSSEIARLDLLLAGVGDPDWRSILASLLLACAAVKEELIVVTRLIPGRNLQEYRNERGQVWLSEKRLWDLLIVEIDRRVPVVCTERNVKVRWTSRFDDTLPATEDGAEFPFCPPSEWWSPETTAWKTKQGRPCWIDALENGWALPQTPGESYHWDLYLNFKLEDMYCVPRLNIVKAGGPEREGRAGALHHIPDELSSHLGSKRVTGWKCK